MFVTLTLPSYGRVDPDLGVPVDPSRYDYRRAALDALHFPKLLDRWVQNTRRCAGYQVQYFAAIEAQRRLADHAHLAIRGAIPRATLKAVTAATYVQVWWPSFEQVVYDGGPSGQDEARLPGWDGEHYRDPVTSTALPTWEQAMRLVDLDATARPMHSMRFGTQVDIKGLIGGTADVDRAVRYLTKYLTKSIAATHALTDEQTGQTAMHPRMAAHVERMHAELRYLPCSPRCANWLRYGVQPRHPGPALVPGRCSAPAHDRENAGLGGRRVLVSRKWTGKTLTDHRADRAAVVRATLAEAGIETADTDRWAADQLCDDGTPRFRWEPLDRDRDGTVDYAQAVIASVVERNARREQYEHAKRRLEQGPPPDYGPSGPGQVQPFGNGSSQGEGSS